MEPCKRRQYIEGRFERMKLKRITTFAVIVVMGLSSAMAQGSGTALTKPADELRRGIELFANEQYMEALPIFDSLFLDPASGSFRADGAYWSAMTLLASGDPMAAEKAIESFLTAFPGHSKTDEMMYHKARAAFIQRDYERALKTFGAFLSAYPEGDQVAAAIFWSAESLYSLGRLPDAEKLYRTIGEEYSDSVKAEAAKYRLSLIQFKYREDELLTLLKWSHEESLKIIEEFQRREKAYEQALEVYHKRYGEAQRGVSQAQASLEDQIDSLKMSMDDLARRLQEKDARVAELESLTESRPDSDTVSPGAMPASERVGNDAELLVLKERALSLMEFYLERLAERSSSGGSK